MTDTMTEESSPNPESPGLRSRPGLVFGFVASALLPVCAALAVVLSPIFRTVPNPPNDGLTPFVLDRHEVDVPSDSVRAAYDKALRLRMVFRAEEAFLSAMLTQTSSREPSLWIDLQDSVATLSIQGVPVRLARIATFEKSILFDLWRSSGGGFDSLSVPFKLIGATANVPRIPMRLVYAPKDTTEARLRPPEAFVTDQGEVYANLYFDREVVVHLVPPADERSWLKAFKHAFVHRMQRAGNSVGNFLSSDPDPPELWVRLEMDPADIRAIYRAIPDGGRMAIRW